MKAIKYWIVLIMLSLSAIGCSTSPGAPKGAVAWCGGFDYTGTFTKSKTSGKALGLSDSVLASKMSVAEVIELAKAMGCTKETV
jgi:hypothetical protein